MSNLVHEALGLLSSMVTCGEKHSDISLAVVQAAREEWDRLVHDLQKMEEDRDRWSAAHGKVSGALVTLRGEVTELEAHKANRPQILVEACDTRDVALKEVERLLLELHAVDASRTHLLVERDAALAEVERLRVQAGPRLEEGR